MDRLHDLRVMADDPGHVRVFIDGREVRGVTRVDLTLEDAAWPQVTLRFYVETVNLERVEAMPDGIDMFGGHG